MKKSAKGEVVLSACQIQATRLNRLEHRRLQRSVTVLHDDLEAHIARIRRQEQGLRYHFTNVVRYIKPNRSYQAWKQAHADEIALDQEQEYIESLKFKQRPTTTIRRKATPGSLSLSTSLKETSAKPYRPLLLLLEPAIERSSDPLFNIDGNMFRPKTSPNNKQAPDSHRVNPLLTMLGGRPSSSMITARQVNSSELSSNYSFSSAGTANGRKLIQGKYIKDHKESDLDAIYRIALQNQAAYKPVENKRIEERKLYDKEFASQHRALRGSMRSAGVSNKLD
ncbi:unnamed protein product [Rotaria socialis]|uniref:Uncharacterized protein n=1 Tax=Rotaria socialis TaxID=392032 RepID=A0A820NBQ4_9BILA|nr:unnamed protein product [Rotaria socialis]CAF3395087.1 unnamed protein product [Rotaria socialis]CAF3406520.1 unnamed protein product [Rotaria socialis]CAF3673898.1 unnamed protein product [Rotaria socialis]CAF4159977.1 unnamed protein product [Rotaria socialis]